MKQTLLWLMLFPGALATTTAQDNHNSPIDQLPPYIRQLTHFGERADWALDGSKILFLEKTFGDVYEVEYLTGEIRPLTHHFFHEGFVRALYLANGDILLSGSRTFDSGDPWESRDARNTELWVLKADLSGPPVPLGVRCKEGPAVSRQQMKIAWALGSRMFQAKVEYVGGIPQLSDQQTLFTSKELPQPLIGWTLEAQNFRLPKEEELMFMAVKSTGKATAEVMGYHTKTRVFTNYSDNPEGYEEPEGTFPDGNRILVESNRHRPDYQGMQSFMTLDIYELLLDKSGHMTRITYFNDDPRYKASNPVVSDDGGFIAFQFAHTEDAAGRGRGILVLDYEAWKASLKK